VYGRQITLSTAAAALLLAPAAATAAGPRAELTVAFRETTPSTPTGLTLDARYLNPEDRTKKPPAITKVVIALPEGTRIDTGALPVCEATNDEIQALGRDACPAESKVGEGKLEVYTGGPNDPVVNDLTLYNGPGQIVEIVSFEGTNATAGIDRLTIEGNVLRGAPPVVPGGPPDGRTAVSRIVWNVPAHGRYLVTPPVCGGEWLTVGEFGFNDGGETRVESPQPCVRPSVIPSRDLRVTVAPTTFRRNRPTPLRVQLASDDPACLEGAIVRVGTRSARTDAGGRATLVALVRHLRRPLLRVDTRSCGRVRTALRVRGPARPASSGRAAHRVRDQRSARP
jgi:hypothetical protein